MTSKQAGFRAFYKHFTVFKITEDDKKTLEGFPGAEQADYFLTYGYVDEEAGLTLEVICCARNLSKGFVFADTRTDIRSFIRFSEVLDREPIFIEQHILEEQYREKIYMLGAYDVSDEVEKTRQLTLVDDCRDLCFVDDVLVYFVKEGLEVEGCWVRLLSVNESTISGILLHDPHQSFKCHKGDIIEFRLQETDEKKIVCVKHF